MFAKLSADMDRVAAIYGDGSFFARNFETYDAEVQELGVSLFWCSMIHIICIRDGVQAILLVSVPADGRAPTSPFRVSRENMSNHV